jgi:hypothetical protein
MDIQQEPVFVPFSGRLQANFGPRMLIECRVSLLLFREAVRRHGEEHNQPFPPELVAWIFRLLAWRYTLLGTAGCFNCVPSVRLDRGCTGTHNEYSIHVPYVWSRDRTVVPTVPTALIEALIQRVNDNFSKHRGVSIVSMEMTSEDDYARRPYTYYIGDGEIVFSYVVKLGIRSFDVVTTESNLRETMASLGRIRGNPASRVVFIQ